MTLSPLATSADLIARSIDTSESDLALAAASAVVREAAGNCISQLTSTVTLPAPRGNLLTLPGPVTSVASVTVNDRSLVLNVDYYVLENGIWSYCGWDYLDRPVPVIVTFTHGLVDVPADIVDLTCALAAMWMAAKATAFAAEPGIESERIDDYAVTTSSDAAGQVSPIWIPERTRLALAARFGGGVGVLEPG